MTLKSTNSDQLQEWNSSVPDFESVLANDEFVKTVPFGTRKCFILNLQNSRQPGSHWTLLDARNPTSLYIDSYGVPPTYEIAKWITSSKRKAFYCTVDLQGYQNNSCGQYATFFAHNLTNTSLNAILSHFKSDTKHNENRITEFMKLQLGQYITEIFFSYKGIQNVDCNRKLL